MIVKAPGSLDYGLFVLNGNHESEERIFEVEEEFISATLGGRDSRKVMEKEEHEGGCPRHQQCARVSN